MGEVTLETKAEEIISFPSDGDLDIAGREKGYLRDGKELSK